MSGGWLRQESESNNLTGGRGRQQRHGGHLIHQTFKPTFLLLICVIKVKAVTKSCTLHIHSLALGLSVKHTIPINKH